MLRRIIRRCSRQPLAAVAVMLFAAVLAVVLCHLHRSGIEEQRSFDKSYASVPVFFKVTELDGSRVENGVSGWLVDLFTDRGLQPNLDPFVEQIHVRVSHSGFRIVPIEGTDLYDSISITMTGISSTYVAEELTEGWGGKIYWRDGFDESVLSTEQQVCLVPESLKDEEKVVLLFQYNFVNDVGDLIEREYRCELQVAGYYTSVKNNSLYCPYPVMQQIHANLGRPKKIEELGAILNDNSTLGALRETAAMWFAEPNPSGEKTPWGRFGYEYYFYALDIDDTMLRNLETNMKNSVRLNQIASAVVFALSAGAGFLTGFLVIRSRKREIALMRTMGASNPSIFAELALEQFACIVLGIVLGGSYTLWQPVSRLCLFGAIYVIGLTAALLVFLRKNLLTTIKEDE